MAAIISTPHVVPNRRRRVRHRIQTPAYASFIAKSMSAMIDLHEIVDISEDGMAIQCHSPLEIDQRLNLCLDLSDAPKPIYTEGSVKWLNGEGRAGLRFSELPPDSLVRLREWLFVNVMAGVANGEAEIAGFSGALDSGPPPPSYSDKLEAVTAVQRQVEGFNSDLVGALQLIAERSQALVRASGAAIALADTDPEFMVCCASSGADAPPVGARLQVGSGFSGDCVRRGMALRCDDAEIDSRVDRATCHALGIRSILAAPVRVGERSVGLIEAFAPLPNAFSDADAKVLERLSESVLNAANRAARAENLPQISAPKPPRFAPSPGSVIFASAEEPAETKPPEEKGTVGISLPLSHLVILVCAAATIFLVLGFISAPWIQSDLAPWIQRKLHARAGVQLATVLASTQAPKSDAPTVETATLDQLRQMAENGDLAAEITLGNRYARGEGSKLDEAEAIHWFTRAAEQGNTYSQSQLGLIFYNRRGLSQDLTQAYFWMTVARANNDDASRVLSPIIRASLTRPQVTSIELEADQWLQQHRLNFKPAAGQLKARN